MAYSTTVTAITGGTLSAAQWNTGVRDNFTAIFVGTTAGDTDYYTSGSTKNRLAIGTAYQFLQVNSGANAPQWGGLHFASVYHNTTQNISAGAAAALVFNSEYSDVQGWHSTSANTSRITVGANGYYQASIYLEYAGVGGSGTYADVVELRKNNSIIVQDRRWVEATGLNKRYLFTSPILSANTSEYFEWFLEQNSGGIRTVAANCIFSLWRVS